MERDGRCDREARRPGAREAGGHRVTAGDYYLRAGIYHYNAERFVPPGPEKKTWARKGLSVLAAGHPAALPEDRIRRSSLRTRHAAGAVHEGRGERTRADRGDLQRHGQREGDEHLLLPGWSSRAAASTRSRSTGRGRARCLRLRDVHEPLRLRGRRALRPTNTSGEGRTSIRSASPSWATASAAITRRASPPSSTATRRASRCRRCTGTSPAGSCTIKEQNRNAPKDGGAVQLPVPWVTGAADADEAIEIATQVHAEGRGEEHPLPVPRHARRQRPRRAGGERAEALRRRRLDEQDHQDLRQRTRAARSTRTSTTGRSASTSPPTGWATTSSSARRAQTRPSARARRRRDSRLPTSAMMRFTVACRAGSPRRRCAASPRSRRASADRTGRPSAPRDGPRAPRRR